MISKIKGKNRTKKKKKKKKGNENCHPRAVNK